MKLGRSVLAMALGAALLAPAALADTVTLTNGREIHGRLVEEKRDSIRMRTEGGVITIPKAQIASFTEGEVFFNYGGKARTQEQVDAATGQPAQPGQQPPAQPGQQPPAGGAGGTSAADWKWPAGLSAEKIEELTPIRDEVLKQLAEIGPTAEERLKAVVTSAEERARIQELIVRFDWQRRQGSANAQRNQARDHVAEFGVKAIPQLVESLKSEAQWTKRISAQALGLIAKTGKPEDTRWLMYHHEVLAGLVTLLDHQGEVDSPFVRADANAALEAVTGRAGNWPAEAKEPLRSGDENRAREVWGTWTKAEKARWTQAEADKEKLRGELQKKVDLLKQGKNPDDQG